MSNKKNVREKIILINQKGEKEEFLYPVDAKEALGMKDKEGNQRYTLPEMVKEKIVNVNPAKGKDSPKVVKTTKDSK